MSHPVKNIQVFVSYKKKKEREAPQIALEIATKLEEDYHYKVFIDQKRLKPGKEWEKEIYDNIHKSDVLIVLLEAETAKSDWVQREVDVARGAHVSILPLQIADEIDFKDAVDRLALDNIQYFRAFDGTEEQYEQLITDIERLSKDTRTAQKTWIAELEQRWRVKHTMVNMDYAVYQLKNSSINCKVKIATGDITEMKNIDVIVNSENDYMQMARVHESESLSSVLRRKGSHIVKGSIKEDTIQQELDEILNKSSDFSGRPIPIEQVVVTHAGHAHSDLAKQNFRYIFHVAAVSIQAHNYGYLPLQTDAAIRSAVLNCLNSVADVDEKKGVISPKTSKRKKEIAKVDEYQAISSIIFPILGTGHGGRPTSEVILPMAQAVADFLLQYEHHSEMTLNLETIYFSAFSETDIPDIVEALERYFERIQ